MTVQLGSFVKTLFHKCNSLLDCSSNLLIHWSKKGTPHYKCLIVYPLSLTSPFLCQSLVPLSWSGCTCLHTTLHTTLMGVNCNWICFCQCQQFPSGSLSVTVIAPFVGGHATVNSSTRYQSPSSLSFFGEEGGVVTSQKGAWCAVSTVNVDVNIVSHVLLFQSALCLLLSKGGLLKFIPFSLCQVVFLTFLSGRHCSPRTLFVRSKQWFPCTSLWDSMPKWEKGIQEDGVLDQQRALFAKSFNRFTTLPLGLVFQATWALCCRCIISQKCVIDSIVQTGRQLARHTAFQSTSCWPIDLWKSVPTVSLADFSL